MIILKRDKIDIVRLHCKVAAALHEVDRSINYGRYLATGSVHTLFHFNNGKTSVKFACLHTEVSNLSNFCWMLFKLSM